MAYIASNNSASHIAGTNPDSVDTCQSPLRLIGKAFSKTQKQELIFQQNLAQLQSKLGLQHIEPESQTYKDLKHYLNDMLHYPSHTLAELHRAANRLGGRDHKLQQIKTNPSKDQADQQSSPDIQQKKTNPPKDQADQQSSPVLFSNSEEIGALSLLWPQVCGVRKEDMGFVGTSVYMLFYTGNAIRYLLLVAFIVFGLFSLISNILCTQTWAEIKKQDLFANILNISLGSKINLAASQNNKTLLTVQVWIGFVYVILLMIAYQVMEIQEAKFVQRTYLEGKTVANYSIVLRGVPINVTQKEIQDNLNKNINDNQKTASEKSIEVVKINTAMPNHLIKKLKKEISQNTEKIKKQELGMRQEIIAWVMQLKSSQQFKQSREQRNQKYQKYQQNIESQFQYIMLKVQAIQNQRRIESGLTNCFVTFSSTLSKETVFKSIKDNFFDKFIRTMSLENNLKTTYMTFGGEKYKVKIQQADQPQDVLWDNVGLKTLEVGIRTFFMYMATLLILGASFAVLYATQGIIAQNQLSLSVKFLGSFQIVIFNFIINSILEKLTHYQYQSSYTKFQTSFAAKSIFAQLINTILIPILVHMFLRQGSPIYSKNGLADSVFFLGLTSAFLPPIRKLIQYSFLNKLIVWYKTLSFYRCFATHKKFYLNQNELNEIYELMPFDIASEYTYIISLYLWTCFFMPLQPILIVFSAAGIYFNYWVQIYCLFDQCKRPVPGTKVLFNLMVQFLYAGGIFYSLGSLTFINFIPQTILSTKNEFALIANILSIIIAGISLFIPYSQIFQRWTKDKQVSKQYKYHENKANFITLQYEQTNPFTSASAIEFRLKHSKQGQQEQIDKINDPKASSQPEKSLEKKFSQITNYLIKRYHKLVKKPQVGQKTIMNIKSG